MCRCGLKRPTDGTEKENMKHINTKEHQKLVEARYNANPKFWDNVYKKNKQKIEQMKKQEQKEKEKEKKRKAKS